MNRGELRRKRARAKAYLYRCLAKLLEHDASRGAGYVNELCHGEDGDYDPTERLHPRYVNGLVREIADELRRNAGAADLHERPAHAGGKGGRT